MKLKALVAGVAMVAAGQAMAFTDGSVVADPAAGTTGSTGTATVNLTVPNVIQVMVFDDAELGTWVPGTDATDTVTLCVWAKSAGGAFTLTTSGAGGGPLEITDGTDTIPYTVDTSLVPAATTAKNAAQCAGASFDVTVTAADADIESNAGDAGLYTGTLELTATAP